MTTPGCTGKIAYPTRLEAERGRTGLAITPCTSRKQRKRRSAAAQLKAYHCENCRSWHLGRSRKRLGPRRPGQGPNSVVGLLRRYFDTLDDLTSGDRA